MSGDLRAVLAEVAETHPTNLTHICERFLAALAAADEPLVAGVDVPLEVPEGYQWMPPAVAVTVVCLTEDVLRERLREVCVLQGGAPWAHRVPLLPAEVDAIVRALFGEGDR